MADRSEPPPERGGAFFDRSEVFDRYQEHRAWPLNPNRTMEDAAFWAEVGAVDGLSVLDLRCGAGETGVAMLGDGCVRYVGIDGSRRMVEAARAAVRGWPEASIEIADLEGFETRPGAFDLIVSRMTMHHLGAIDELLQRCYGSLADGGRLILTVTHPVITSNDRRTSTDEPRQDWVVDRYFMEGPRSQTWLGAPSIWHHRTIESYVRALCGAGFALWNLRECPPDPARFDDAAEFARRQRIPLMLLLSASR